MNFKTNKAIPQFENTKLAFEHLSNKALSNVYLVFFLMNKNWLVKIGTFFIKIALKIHLPIKNIIKKTVFSVFCGGETIKECQKTIDNLAAYHVGTILDYSVEGKEDEAEFDKTVIELLKTIEKAANEPSKIPFSVFKVSGIASNDLLEKIQLKKELSQNEKDAYGRVKLRIEKLCLKAAELNVRLFIDAEESWIQDTIDELTYEMMRKYNKNGKTIVYNTFQFYRWATLPNLKNIVEIAQNENFTVGCKFVRGAYMEKERERAENLNYKDPIQPTKEATDTDFDNGVEFALKNLNIFAICLGTHNEKSCLKCVEKMYQMEIAPSNTHVFFAQLLGMSDNLSFNLANSGFNVAKYVPYGPIDAVMPYLIRRAEENTSISGQSSRELTLVKKEVDRRKHEIKH